MPFSLFPCGHGAGGIPMQLTQPVVLRTPWETEGSAGKPSQAGLHPPLLCFQSSGNQPNCSLLLIHWTAGPLVQGQSLSRLHLLQISFYLGACVRGLLRELPLGQQYLLTLTHRALSQRVEDLSSIPNTEKRKVSIKIPEINSSPAGFCVDRVWLAGR